MIHQLKRLPLWILFALIVLPITALSVVVHITRVAWILGRRTGEDLSTWLVKPAPPRLIKLDPVTKQREHHTQATPW